jgi:nucleoside-diphosphate-sugar epimerase
VEPQEMFETIVDGTRRVLQFAAASGCRKLLFVSSGAVYGKQPPELTHIPEDYLGAPDPLDPASAYGEGKRAAEMLCVVAGKKHGFEIKIARCFAFVGPHLPLDAHFAIGNFIRDALAGSPIRVNGDGTPLRSYLYAADLAVWLWTLLFAGTAGKAYNVGSDQAVSIADLSRTIADLISLGAQVEIARQSTPGAPVAIYVPSTDRARLELNLHSFVDLESAIRRSITWHRRYVEAAYPAYYE